MHLLFLFTLFFFFYPSQKKWKNSEKLIVRVTNIPNDKGKVYLHIYDTKEDYLKKSCYPTQVKTAKKGSLEFIYEDIPFNAYAIMAHHDENDNGEMDSYFFGLPKEYYGFSNNARSVYGPPSFSDAQFVVDKKEMKITFKVQ